MRFLLYLLVSALATITPATATNPKDAIVERGTRQKVLLGIVEKTIDLAIASPDALHLTSEEVSRISSLVSKAKTFEELKLLVVLFRSFYSEHGELNDAPLDHRLSRGEYEALRRISMMPGNTPLKFLERIHQEYLYHATMSLTMEDLIRDQKARTQSVFLKNKNSASHKNQ